MDEKTLKKLLKDALKDVATKDDLKNFITKDDAKVFATKNDLKGFATKDDLKQMKVEICTEISDIVNDFIEEIDKTKADKKDLQELDKRVTVLENY